MVNLGDRIVVLIDMDCFFCQVETKLQPRHAGKPLAVVQYNQWKMGGIIAVNYEARSFGVTRHMRGKEAKEKCPDIVLVSVPCLRGKADTTRYRKAGREVIDVIKKHCSLIERASVDEAYLDITNIVDKKLEKYSPKELLSLLVNTYIVGYSEIGKNDENERCQGLKTWILNSFNELHDIQAQKLAVAGVIVEEIRASIYKEIGYRCSAGIAQNKILAKLACGLHKPNCQTILPEAAIATLYSTLPVKKVRSLGGKFGDAVVESLGCKVMGDLLRYSLEQLQQHFDVKTGLWLYNIARGIDNEPVTSRLLSKSVGACKKFPGKQAITTLEVLKHWANELAAEVCERLEQDLVENQRRATFLMVSYHYYQNKRTVSQSRSLALTSYKPEKMASQCVDVVTKSTQCPVAFLGISAGKFIPSKRSNTFLNFFKSDKPVDNTDNKINAALDKSETTNSPVGESTLESNLEVIEINAVDSNGDEFIKTVENPPAIVTGAKDLIQHAESVATKDKKITNNALINTNAEDSPTARKVYKLMQVCSERDETKSKNKRTSSVVINKNDFQSSFFMNIFKTDCKDHPDSIESDKAGLDMSDVSDKSNSDLCMRENDYEQPSTSSARSLVYSDGRGSPEKEKKEEITAQNPSVQLREIFPNLDDIDPDILLLLPADLQEEARSYMKSRKRENAVKVSRDLPAKTKKGKSGKTKATGKEKRRSPLLYNFLIKTNSSEPLERCDECGQMIPVTRFSEHADFHVAQNLCREINKPSLSENATKRKLESSEVVITSAKRQPNVQT